MYIINVKYKVSLDELNSFIPAHRSYLAELCKKDLLLCSGPAFPRIGGVIVALVRTKEQLEEIIKNDPFYINNLAEYSHTEFDPLLKHNTIENLLTR